MVYLAIIGILFVSYYLFDTLNPRTAVVAVVVIGWLFLPSSRDVYWHLPMIPYKTKLDVISLSLLFGILLKDRLALRRFTYSWVDIPMTGWITANFFSSMTNDLGIYNAVSGTERIFIDWGIPYMVGRIYFGTFEGFKDLGIGMIVGAVLIAPLALIEAVVSPIFHIMIYGYYPHDINQARRASGLGWRPSVFMSHGLELAIYNAVALLMGWQFYLRKVITRRIPVLNTPLFPSLVLLSFVFIASLSVGAIEIFLLSMVLLQVASIFKTRLPLLLLLLLPVTYMTLRGTGSWDGRLLVDTTQSISQTQDRTASLAFRLHQETLLIAKADQNPIFGWGGYARSFLRDQYGHLTSTPDGNWIIIFGENGLFGLFSFCGLMLLGPLLLFLRCHPRRFTDPLVMPSIAFAVCLAMNMTDYLFNAFHNPVLMIASGGLLSLSASSAVISNAEINEENHFTPLVSIPSTRVI